MVLLEETTRQYLPELETRWGISRKQIVEHARDGKLALWVDLLNMRFAYKKQDGEWTKGWPETASRMTLKFHSNSLEQLASNIDISRYSNVTSLDGKRESIICGILRDGREVLAIPDNYHCIRVAGEPLAKIWIEYSKVYAFLEDVKNFENSCAVADVPEKTLAEPKEDQLPSKREKTYLKMIGALLSMRYTGDAYIKTSGQVNASAVAERFNIDLANAGFTDEGLKADTLRKTLIVPAFEAIEENKKQN